MKAKDPKHKDPTLAADDGQTVSEVPQESEETSQWKTNYLRALADYQNLERRCREEKDEIRKYAAENILARMLPALDTLARAKEHLRDVGLDLSYKEFISVLEEQGVTRIKTVGEHFDPYMMECIEVVEGEDDIVVAESLPGYTLNGKVLRVARVTVGKKQQK